jgi:hypothetical protein
MSEANIEFSKKKKKKKEANIEAQLRLESELIFACSQT